MFGKENGRLRVDFLPIPSLCYLYLKPVAELDHVEIYPGRTRAIESGIGKVQEPVAQPQLSIDPNAHTRGESNLEGSPKILKPESVPAEPCSTCSQIQDKPPTFTFQAYLRDKRKDD
jgi:hypothetical protein